jgi:glycosyltransferase involved in cell wall biosynthesis
MKDPGRPLISVITAALCPSDRFLDDAYSSLGRQEVPWEWLLQIDGPEQGLPSFPDDDRVRVEANGLHLGTAGTRNRALARARGELIFALDADDVIAPRALPALCSALLSEDDDIAFAFGRAGELGEDGRSIPGSPSGYFKPGVVKPGTVERLWHETGLPPIHGTAVLWRKAVLAAYGGWPALLGSEDTSVIMAASLEHPVAYVEHDVVLYRRHAGQTTQAAPYHLYRQRNWDLVHLRLQGMRLTTRRRLPTPIADAAPRAPK